MESIAQAFRILWKYRTEIGIPSALVAIGGGMKWWKSYRAKKIEKAVRILRARASILLLEPNSNAIQSKTFWASLLPDPNLIDEALRETAHPMPGLGKSLGTDQELWEVDAGQTLVSAPKQYRHRG